jgi:DNA repair photolyase
MYLYFIMPAKEHPMAFTEIQWTWRSISLPSGDILVIKGYTYNPWWGCLKVSEECKHCYAEDIAHHYGHDVWGPAMTTFQV